MKKLLFPTALFGLFLATSWFTACQKDTLNSVTPAQTNQATDLAINGTPTTDLQLTDRGNGNSKVFPPNANMHGKSYTEWSQIWMEQFMLFDCASNPWLNPGNELFYTSGPVYMAAGIQAVGGSANMTIPHGKALLFPLVNFINDYPCPAEWNFEPAPGQSMEDFLTQATEDALSNVSIPSLSVTVDGDAVSNLGSFKFVTDLFYFTAHPSLAGCFDPCVVDGPEPGVAGGYYIMLKPLSNGQHTVHYHMEIPAWGAVQDATYNITVQ
ncbi:MAG: hypothetical protein HY842_05305 [Bacteroidetes bacterium]|nr:hypothetical protein [Bacteroidota bacterium]